MDEVYEDSLFCEIHGVEKFLCTVDNKTFCPKCDIELEALGEELKRKESGMDIKIGDKVEVSVTGKVVGLREKLFNSQEKEISYSVKLSNEDGSFYGYIDVPVTALVKHA